LHTELALILMCFQLCELSWRDTLNLLLEKLFTCLYRRCCTRSHLLLVLPLLLSAQLTALLHKEPLATCTAIAAFCATDRRCYLYCHCCFLRNWPAASIVPFVKPGLWYHCNVNSVFMLTRLQRKEGFLDHHAQIQHVRKCVITNRDEESILFRLKWTIWRRSVPHLNVSQHIKIFLAVLWWRPMMCILLNYFLNESKLIHILFL